MRPSHRGDELRATEAPSHRGTRCHRQHPQATEAPGTTAAGGEASTVGLLFDLTGRGDKSFNDSAAAGLDKAAAELRHRPERVGPVG